MTPLPTDAFDALHLLGKKLLPIVQGGMGVAISAKSLAGAVAAENAVGTIASVDLRHLHEDLLAASKKTTDSAAFTKLNLIALDREIKSALQYAKGKGLIAVNVMKAVSDYPYLVRQACESGAHAVVSGAGLPLDLPDLAKDYPTVGLIPILSESRGIGVILKRWMKKNRLPDAIVIENPAYAAGHLGATQLSDLHDGRFSFRRVLDETFELFKKLELEREIIPLIIAGGMSKFEKIKTALTEWGASAIQIGTAFAVTKEGDAHRNFKQVLASAGKKDITEFMSVAGLPARGVSTQFLKQYLKREKILQDNAKADPRRCTQGLNCLSVCGLRDGISTIGQFCIDLKLSAAFRGEVSKGLFFRGSEPLPFGEAMRSVKETIHYLLTGEKPSDLSAEAIQPA